MGVFVGHQDGVTRYYHGGEGLGITAINLIYPESRLALVVLSNTNATGTVNQVADQLTYLLVLPTPRDALARRIFAGLVAGAPDLNLFGPDLKAYLTPGLLAIYRSSLGGLGAVESFVALRPQTVDGLETRDYDVEAGGHRLRLHLLVQADGLIVDASILDQASH